MITGALRWLGRAFLVAVFVLMVVAQAVQYGVGAIVFAILCVAAVYAAFFL